MTAGLIPCSTYILVFGGATVTVSAADAPLTSPARSVCLTVSAWAPLLSVELVIDQLPDPSAMAVPSTVVPSVS